MAKISGLIFSADPIKETLAAAEHLLEFTDEVVILYAGSKSQYKKLCKSIHDKRIKPHYTLKIGYPEPFRYYGIQFCRYDIIAMLDVDERFSSPEAAKKLLNSGEADTYRLQRHEITPKNKAREMYTKQYRLFRKGALEWRGLLHETPRICGSIKDIPIKELHILHKTGVPKKWNYNKLNEVFPVDRPIHMAIRDAYVVYSFEKLNSIATLKLIVKRYSEYKKGYSALPKDNKRIIQRLRSVGIINYLGLNTRKGAEKAIQKYSRENISGIDLLIKMVHDKYTNAK